jgi:hypothetical protein
MIRRWVYRVSVVLIALAFLVFGLLIPDTSLQTNLIYQGF